MRPPSYVCWLISPSNYSYLRTINHSYWSYLHQLSYLGGLTLYGIDDPFLFHALTSCFFSIANCLAPSGHSSQGQNFRVFSLSSGGFNGKIQGKSGESSTHEIYIYAKFMQSLCKVYHIISHYIVHNFG